MKGRGGLSERSLQEDRLGIESKSRPVGGLAAVGGAVQGFSASTSSFPGGGKGGERGGGGRLWLDLSVALLYRGHMLLLLAPWHELRVDHEVVDGAVGLEARVQ